MQSEIASQLTQNKCFCQGVDRQGRAIIFLSAGNHVADDAALLRRFLAYCLDLGIKMCDTTKNPERKMTGIFDLEGTNFGVMTMIRPCVGLCGPPGVTMPVVPGCQLEQE